MNQRESYIKFEMLDRYIHDSMIYLNIRHNNIVEMSSDLFSCQRDIDTLVRVTSSWGLQLNAKKCCVIRFACKKSSIERLVIFRFM